MIGNRQWQDKFRETINSSPMIKAKWKKLQKVEIQYLQLKNDFQAADEDPGYKAKLAELNEKSLEMWDALTELIPKERISSVCGYRDRPLTFWLIE